MLGFSRVQKKRTAAFVCLLLLAVLGSFPPLWVFHSFSAFVYIAILLAWGLTVRSRILHDRIRRLLLCSCAFMILIFVLRICRYDLFRESLKVGETMLYLYAVCYTVVALQSFLVALCVGRGESGDPLCGTWFLWLLEGLLCFAMLSNPRHGLFYVFEPGTIEIKVHGPLYFLMILWCAVFAIASIVLLLIRCRNSVSRRYWFLPAGAMAIGVAFLVWYFIAGGAPKIGPYKLFNVQEAFCLTAILPFEAMFLIGLIPTNNDYDLFFRNASIKAAILDRTGNPVIVSPSYRAETAAGEREQSAEIAGGSVVWTEDISEFLRLREELTSVNADLAEENELIEEENRLREERIAFETRNRLYDSISEALKPQTEAMKRLLEQGEEQDDGCDDLRGNLKFALLMGVYIKRMGNLMLLADGKKTLSIDELALSVSESFEYMKLGGIACSIRCLQHRELPAPQLLFCFRLFEHIAEKNYHDIHAFEVELLPSEDVVMRMALDCPVLLGTEDGQLRSAARELGLELASYRRDDTCFAELVSAGKEENK